MRIRLPILLLMLLVAAAALLTSCSGSGSSSSAPAQPGPVSAPATVDGRPREADDIEQAILQARNWTERQVAPAFPDFEKRFTRITEPTSLCNAKDSGTCVWEDGLGGIHLNIGFTLMDAQGVWISPQRRLTHCDVWDKSIPAKELPVIGKWFTCKILF